MAVKTLFLLDVLASASAHMELQDGGSAPADATTGTGWTVAKTAAGNYARMDSQSERAANQFGATAQPDGAPDNTLGDCFRTAAKLTGDFASGSWTLAFPVIAVTGGGDQDGRIRVRMWRSVNEDGSAATEITAATQVGSTVTNLTNGAAQTSSITFNPGAFSLSGEYLFIQLAWEITGAGGNNNRDVLLRVGSAAKVDTSDFTDLAGIELAAALSGAGTLGAALSVERPLAAALSGAGSLAADLSVVRPIGGLPSGIPVYFNEARAGEEIQLAAALSGAGGLAGALVVERGLAAGLSGAGTLGAAVSVDRALAVSMLAEGTLVADLALAGQIVLEAGLSGAGSLAASLAVDRGFAATLGATGTLAAALQTEKQLFASLLASGTLSAALLGAFEFVTPLEVAAHMSASIRQASPDTPDPTSVYMRLNATVAAQIQALLEVGRGVAIGAGAQVLHALLVLKKASDFSGLLTVDPLDETWDPASVTWNNQPAIRAGETASATVAAGLDDIEVNVTTMVANSIDESDAAGTGWFGVRIAIDAVTDCLIHSSYSPDPDLRPLLLIEISHPPVAPFDLLPAGGRHVSQVRPELVGRFADIDGEDTMAAIQVQVSEASSFETTEYDSGWVDHTIPRFDLAAPPVGAPAPTDLLFDDDVLAPAGGYWWQMRVRDNHGIESEWSEPANFRIMPAPTLAIDSPVGPNVSSPTPTIAWTSTGQTRFELEVERRAGELWIPHYLLPWVEGAAQSATIPDANALEEGSDYRITVRAADGLQREDMPGDRSFAEDSVVVVLETVSV